MPRKKRNQNNITPLAMFIKSLISEGYSLRAIGKIAGNISPSVVHGWSQGAMPTENLDSLRCLANHFEKSLSTVLTGKVDKVTASDQFDRVPFYEGLMEVRLVKLVPKKSEDS